MSQKLHFEEEEFRARKRVLRIAERRDKLKSSGEFDRLNAAVYVEFLVDVAEVTFDGAGRYEYFIADLVIR